MQFFPNFDGHQDSNHYNLGFDEQSVSDFNENEYLSDGKKIHWRNDAYWRLPENVRNAIDLANMKSKHTQFWHRLEALNDKIFVFRDVFYGRVPAYQRAFYEKKR